MNLWTFLCLGAHLPLRGILRSLRKKPQFPVLPIELWAEIFEVLDNASLVVVSRVCLDFNAHALPIYLSRHGIPSADLRAGKLTIPESRLGSDVLPALQTAFTLPPIHELSCIILGGPRRLAVIRNLTRLIAQQKALADVHLTLYEETFKAFDRKGKFIPRHVVQREVCRLLNCATPRGKTLVIAGDRLLVSGVAPPGKLWRVVRPMVAPARGRRAKIRTAALRLKLKARRAATDFDLTLTTVGEVRGAVRRESLVLDALRCLHVAYAPSPGAWATMVIDPASVMHLNLVGSLSAEDWEQVLPLLTLPNLVNFRVGRRPVYTATDLHDIACEDLDPFLLRHPRIQALEYFPQYPSLKAPATLSVPKRALSLAVFPALTSLTTTPAHFLRLHAPPNAFPTLTELIFFAPASTPLTQATEDFTAVLHLMATTRSPSASASGSDSNSDSDAPTPTPIPTPILRLRLPSAWITLPPPSLHVTRVFALLLYETAPTSLLETPTATLAAFLAAFNPGLRRVELRPAGARTFAHLSVVDALRRELPWLGHDAVSCARGDGAWTQRVPARGERVLKSGLKYDD
ncbi:hypothetical protein C8R46DRAFT_1044066 [Mycena filopes]|nr:hypothetical protein C8R46DRAFT_1044066 [Mycena filopes]